MSNSASTSAADSRTDNNQQQGRQVAKRAFAAELNDAIHMFKKSDEERAPNFALLPSGEIANRYFLVGTITEVNDVGNDSEYWQARVVDPTGTVFAYAGQYQPEAAAFLSSLEPPAYVTLTAKPSTYETDDGGVNVSLRPETITHVDAATRNRWVAETIARTEARLDVFESDDGENSYVAMSREQYDADLEIYREALNDAREDIGMEAVSVSTLVPESGADADSDPDSEITSVESDESTQEDALTDGDEDAVDEAAIAAAVANADLEE
jgi:RPA family protein